MTTLEVAAVVFVLVLLVFIYSSAMTVLFAWIDARRAEREDAGNYVPFHDLLKDKDDKDNDA